MKDYYGVRSAQLNKDTKEEEIKASKEKSTIKKYLDDIRIAQINDVKLENQNIGEVQITKPTRKTYEEFIAEYHNTVATNEVDLSKENVKERGKRIKNGMDDLYYGTPKINYIPQKELNEERILGRMQQLAMQGIINKQPATPNQAFKAGFNNEQPVASKPVRNGYITYKDLNFGSSNETIAVDPFEYDPTMMVTEEETIEYTYRYLLTPNKRESYYVRFPKDYPADDNTLLDIALRGSDRQIRIIDNLPNQNVNKNPKSVKKPGLFNAGLLNIRIPKVEHNNISLDDFELKFSNLFTKPVLNIKEFYKTYKTIGRDQFLRFLGRNTCVKNQCLSFKNDHTREVIYGLTTGVYYPESNSVEVITINKTLRTGSYNDKSSYKLSKFNLDAISFNDNSAISKFIRYKIIDYKNSVSEFGQPTIKKKLKGKILIGERVRPTRLTNKTGEKVLDCAEIYTSKTSYIFCLEDLQMFEIDPNLLPKVDMKENKKIKVGSQVKLIDDRKLVNFKKGDQATVMNLSPSKSNFKNSLVVISNKNIKETVLLKQVKLYDNNSKKEEDTTKDVKSLSF